MIQQNKIFIFNILPRYRPGMSDVFDYARHRFNAAALPSLAQRTKQNTLFVDMEDISGNCLSDLDLFYPFATDGDSDFAKINWVSPGDNQLSQSGTVTHTSNLGFQGNGTNGYLDPGYTPSTDAVNYATDDATVFYASLTDVGNNSQFDFGCNAGGADPSVFFNARTGSDVHQGRINSSTAETRGTAVSSIGFFQIQRTPTVGRFLKNGSQVGADLLFGGAGLPARSLAILANNSNGSIQLYSTRQMSVFGLGSSLSGNESALYTAWNTYFTSL